jgi:hypothetical protein
MPRLTITQYAGICLSIVLFAGCEKIEKGFLSDNMYYVDNPLVTSQGSVTVSSSLVADGSTTPLHVELTRVVDDHGNDMDSVMTKTDSIIGFSGNVTYLDSTLDLLSKKIQTTAAKPLSVSPLGGRIQLTPATQYVPLGSYTIDVKVTNIRGTHTLAGACTIVITGSSSPDTVYSGTYGGTFDPSTGTFLAGIANPVINVSYSATATNKIIYKFVDKNGKLYDAKTWGIGTRKNRWNMKQFDPYYPQVLTDTSVEYQYPTVPNQFPAFINPGVNGVIPRGNYGTFFAMPAASNSTGASIFAFVDMAFFKPGTHIVTVTLTDIAWN